MKFTRTVSCTNEDVFRTPDILVVDISPALAERIRELAAEVKRLNVGTITLSNDVPDWHEADWDKDGESDDGMYPVPGEECTNLDCATLVVRGDDCWWEAYLKGSSAKVSSESILLSELPE